MADLIYPDQDVIDQLRKLAWDYAQRSLEFTINYGGWEPESEEDVEKKKTRIAIGKIGQLWLKRVCELNQVPFIDDITDYETPDEYDVIIYNHKFDVKTTKNGFCPGQINSALRTKPMDYYCFVSYICNTHKLITHGVITFEDFWEQSTFIAQGELLPGTNTYNRFSGGSNVLEDLSVLNDLEDVLTDLKKRAWFDSFKPEIESIIDKRLLFLLNSMLNTLNSGKEPTP
jgi:hypothetical protein